MTNDPKDAWLAAIPSSGPKPPWDAVSRRVPLLRAVDMARPEGSAASTDAAVVELPHSQRRTRNTQDRDELGRAGLRLAFWLCGFHEALMERLRQGAELSASEESLLALSREDFAYLRPLVVHMTLGRLHAVVNAPDLEADNDGPGPGHLEEFALDTLRGLSRRARRLMREKGPDAALSLFGHAAGVQEPLAIFQLIFTTALSLVEAFERILAIDSTVLGRLADALDSEVEKI